MQWVRGWTYELHWARGHSGVRARVVYTAAGLRVVAEWARINPHIERYTSRVTYDLVGERIEHCPDGHSLLTVKEAQPYRRGLKMLRRECRACPGHWVTICRECGASVFDPPLLEGCGPQNTGM